MARGLGRGQGRRMMTDDDTHPSMRNRAWLFKRLPVSSTCQRRSIGCSLEWSKTYRHDLSIVWRSNEPTRAGVVHPWPSHLEPFTITTQTGNWNVHASFQKKQDAHSKTERMRELRKKEKKKEGKRVENKLSNRTGESLSLSYVHALWPSHLHVHRLFDNHYYQGVASLSVPKHIYICIV